MWLKNLDERIQAYDIPVSQSKISTNEDSQPSPERNLGNSDWIPKGVGKFSISTKATKRDWTLSSTHSVY